MTPAPPFRRSFGVVIGIDQYAGGIPPLRTAVNDARRLGELLAQAHGYEVTALLDEEATQARITQLLTHELPAIVQPDDRVLFYFAGHGVARDGDEGPNGYLLPADARRGDEGTYLHMPLVHDALLALPCRHMLVVLDSCFSGAFRWSGTRDIMEEFEVVHQEKYDRFVRDPAWQVITSASQDQKAIDQLSAGALGERAVVGDHSPFANALFEAISGRGDLIPRGEGDGLVTATELYLYLEESLQQAVSVIGASQTPRLWPLKKHDKGEFVFFVPGRDLVLPPAPELTFERNPWQGLASYDAGNAALFFGRDAEIATLRDKIGAQPLTVVLGASGTGKSSLVKAGAVPRLRTDGWFVLPVMRPGSTPMAALAQALAGDGAAVASTAEAISARVGALVAAHAPKPVLLVIDQFEELITLARHGNDRDTVLTLLARLVEQHPDGFRLVVTIRTDFEPNFDRTAFGDRWTAGRFVIPPMSRENMKAVIEQPAAARVLYFEPSNLVETLLDEVVATPGALPLLSFALSEMYIAFVKRQGGDRAITRSDYDAVGGVAGALRSRAEAEYAALDEAHRGTLRRVMLRLVSSDGAGLARRRVSDDELTFADAAEQARAKTVVERLTTARLLVEGREADGATFVEPAHDALVRGWGRLLEWVRDEGSARFPLLQQQRLARAAEEWERTGDASRDGMLWRDAARSAQLAPLVRQRVPWFNARELAFARRSIRGRNIARATAAAAALIIVVAGAVAAIAGLRASRRAEEVRIASVARTAQSMVSEDPLLAALLLGSIDSAMVARLDDATRLSILGTAQQLGRGPQVSMTFGSRLPLNLAAMSGDGRWLVEAEGIEVWLHQLGSGISRRLPADTTAGTKTVAFDSASTQVALGSLSGLVHVSTLDESRATPLVFAASSRLPLIHVAFSRSGSLLLVTNAEGTLRVVDLEAARRAGVRAPVPGDTTIIDERLVRWRADGVQFAVALEGGRVATVDFDHTTLQLWSATGLKERAFSLPSNEKIAVLEVSPDGRSVAIGSNSGALRLVSLGQRPQPVTLGQHAGAVVALAWSPDGRQLVSTGVDNTVRLWNAATRTLQRSILRPDEPMQTATFSADGRLFVTSSPYTYHAVVFDTSGAAITLPGHTNEIFAAGVAADGRIVTAARDGGIWLWTGPPAPLHQTAGGIDPAYPSGGDITAVGFTRDSRAVALGSRDGLLYRYRLDSAAGAVLLDTLPGTLRALHWSADGNQLHALRYDGGRLRWTFGAKPRRSEVDNPRKEFLVDEQQSRDGRYVLAQTTDGDATVWDITDSVPPLRVMMVRADSVCRDAQDEKYDPELFDCEQRKPECAAMSGNGEWLATCRADGSIMLHRRDGRISPRRITIPFDFAGAVALSADGRVLAASFALAGVRTWPTDVPADTGRSEKISEVNVERLVFSPDGQRLAALTNDNWVHVLDRTTGVARPVLRPRGQALQLLRFTPDGRHLITVGRGEKEARLWTVDGAGSAVSLDAGGGLIAELAVSPDGRWIVTTNDRQGAQLHPLDVNLALTPFRNSPVCLSAARRQRYLVESAGTAQTRYAACEAKYRAGDAAAQR